MADIQGLLFQLGYELSLDNLISALSVEHRSDDIFVALLDEKVIGVMSLICFDYFPSLQKICRITAISIDKNNQGRGVGTQLIEFAKIYGLEHGCKLLEVTTSLQREKTQKYYENIGFTKSSFRYVQKIGM
jgi:GNAT superfamily N-acetyltransferase